MIETGKGIQKVQRKLKVTGACEEMFGEGITVGRKIMEQLSPRSSQGFIGTTCMLQNWDQLFRGAQPMGIALWILPLGASRFT